MPRNRAKQGISVQKGAHNYYDKSTFRVPRHSSFTIMQDLAKWGRVRHNMAESLANTTVSTTKAHEG